MYKCLKYNGLLLLMVLLAGPGMAQDVRFEVHDRGMLHETVYNTGEIGRPWQTGEQGNVTSYPLMEWPRYSKTIVNGIEYSGQHNLMGAGMYIGANLDNLPGEENRLFALSGAVGSSDPETVAGRWSFPLSIEKIENYPVNPDGTLNDDYDPNEAEQIIIAEWATSIGITVTRTSRQYSQKDYDDFIIYEYTLEYTGDTDGTPASVERTQTLHDVMVCFNYGMAPSMYGFQRWYQEWKYEGGIYRGDLRAYWDAELWLKFNLDNYVNKTQRILAKPEPDPDLFREFAETGKNGGGLASPQAPGWAMIYYDTTKLAPIVPEELEAKAAAQGIVNESEAARKGRIRTTSIDSSEYDPAYHNHVIENELGTLTWFYELDENYHMKQPWTNKVSTGNVNSQKMMYEKDPFNPSNRWSGVYKTSSNTWPEPPHPEERWIGRAAFNYRQTSDAGMQLMTFGPYSLEHGDVIEFSLAEVIGYGSDPGKRVEGGGVPGEPLTQWSAAPNWNGPVVINGDTLTKAYIDEFGYPDYVNSDVVSVQDVTKKAFEAYLGHPPTLPFWPEDNPKNGVYTIQNPAPPAPALVMKNTPDARIRLIWKNAVEDFPYLTDDIVQYNVYRATAGMGPWQLLDSVAVGSDSAGVYELVDADQSFKVGDTRFYALSSVDAVGRESGKTNIVNWRKDVASVEKMTDVYVVPNPFIEESGFEGNPAESVGFYGLPEECMIRIYSYAGQLVDKIQHNEAVYSNNKTLVTINHQEMASGIYFYVVTTPDGDQTSGKFIILK
ncbi:MAG: T9SS type A sorting domain-containing protein [Candidatus Marinimicrobia bacterium]|nr:T9SS type A sorting domain-containing protein [Candidatus Neomarinimicrobiota bacterium]MCF7828923.1 T9SS type A sorting domain-containing protein [Candidatus Neomarinimicrobiota bacterium]MCF7879883.1 T9SS type A sorting domain-containing protein [Candidatus Neomarinimicrobiota bacterium]